jgi:hypothetical protein
MQPCIDTVLLSQKELGNGRAARRFRHLADIIMGLNGPAKVRLPAARELTAQWAPLA